MREYPEGLSSPASAFGVIAVPLFQSAHGRSGFFTSSTISPSLTRKSPLRNLHYGTRVAFLGLRQRHNVP
jgi:hypothetical protein